MRASLLILLTVFVFADPAHGAPTKPAPNKADIPYGPDPSQLLDVYVPPQATAPCPVLIWFGGLWKPSKGTPDLNRFLPKGIAAVAVQTGVMGDAKARQIDPPVAVCLLDAVR